MLTVLEFFICDCDCGPEEEASIVEDVGIEAELVLYIMVLLVLFLNRVGCCCEFAVRQVTSPEAVI